MPLRRGSSELSPLIKVTLVLAKIGFTGKFSIIKCTLFSKPSNHQFYSPENENKKYIKKNNWA